LQVKSDKNLSASICKRRIHKSNINAELNGGETYIRRRITEHYRKTPEDSITVSFMP